MVVSSAPYSGELFVPPPPTSQMVRWRSVQGGVALPAGPDGQVLKLAQAEVC
jgi:hypothetical protein